VAQPKCEVKSSTGEKLEVDEVLFHALKVGPRNGTVSIHFRDGELVDAECLHKSLKRELKETRL